jgi:hypothetical protein
MIPASYPGCRLGERAHSTGCEDDAHSFSPGLLPKGTTVPNKGDKPLIRLLSEVSLQYTGEVCKMGDMISFSGYIEPNIKDHYNFENRDWEPLPDQLPGVTDADFRELGIRKGYRVFWSSGDITIEVFYRFKRR